MKSWNGKNVLWMLIYLVLYMVGTFITCVLGSVHPIMFVCYQIVAGILLSGIVIKAFDRVKTFGVALFFSIGIVLIFFLIGDASAWHIVPLFVIGVMAELIRFATKYNRTGDMVSTVIMTFSTFGFYGQIWFNRDFTYSEAIEEMPAGYADTLMNCSPVWALPVVLIIGIAASVLISNLTAKIFKLER
ncbi:MAG: MptD family putative ECF transporter S component [Lachnospiraceae bacterium]|nr:MptD family putative ECF transporter S component [Lachnospiraceae bacterium]